jgi:hypothetical protein
MPLRVSWAQALAWRMSRQLLDPITRSSVREVVRRLCGVQAQVASSAELAVRVRREASRPGDVNRALADGGLIKTWAMRGTLHLLTPEDGGALLSLLAAARSWERPSWVRWFGLAPKEMESLRAVVREALDGRVLTREELVDAVTARPDLGHVAEGLRSGWGTLLKPLAWQGDLCFGPMRGSRVTFMRPDHASARWAGVPEPDIAGPVAIVAYFTAYGPATAENFRNFVARGGISVRQVRTWFASVGDRLVEIEVDGERALLLADDLEELAATKPSTRVRLLPGFDQYVMGPGTDDAHVIPAGRRSAVSKQSGWIAPVVLLGGVVRATWELDGSTARIAWFAEAGAPPRDSLEAEVARLSSILGRPLETEIRLA